MARAVSIGNQDFEAIQKEGYFYIDKTMEDEKEFSDTVQRVLKQILDRNYKTSLAAKGSRRNVSGFMDLPSVERRYSLAAC